MTYPIDADAYIAAMRRTFRPDDFRDRAHRTVISLVNGFYADGLAGRPAPDRWLREQKAVFLEQAGPVKPGALRLLDKMLAWCSTAYQEGVLARG